MRRFLSLLVLLALVLSTISCGFRPYSVKKGNDAVTAARQIEDRVVKSGCSAENYIMDITLDTDKNTVSGKETVIIINNSGGELEEICFRYFAPAFEERSKITRVSNREIDEEYSFTEEARGTFYRVALPEALDKGEKIILDLEFTSYIPDIPDRFGIVSFGEKERLYNLTFCFPQVAFLDNGVWFDSEYFEGGEALYNEMSDYFVTLTAPEEYVILSAGRSTTENGKTNIVAANVREMAIAACNCATVYTKESDGIIYNLLKIDLDYKNKELQDDTYELIMETAIEAVEIFSRDIGDYIYDELDIIPVAYDNPGIGGMEFPGLIQTVVPFSDSSPNTEDDTIAGDEFFDDLKTTVEVVCHEVGHQWFYCAVGNDEMNEAWIDESFASYLDAYFMKVCQRSWDLYHRMLLDYNNGYDDEFISSYEFDQEMTDFDNNKYYINFPAEDYKRDHYGCVYDDGTVFLQELQRTMGDESFFEMLSAWYSENLNGIAEGYAFINHVMEYDSSDAVKQIINAYVSDERLQ